MNVPQDFVFSSALRLSHKSSAIGPGAAATGFTRSLLALLFLVASAAQVQGVVTEYTSRSSWDSAVGGAPDTTENFNGAADQVEFDSGGPYSAAGFTLSATFTASPTDQFANFVDGIPVSGVNVINSGADAPHAHMFVDGDSLPSGAVPQQVTLTFPNPVFAWGANLEVNPTGTETVTIELRRADNGLEGTLTLANGVTAFRGFTSTTGIKTLVIKGSGNSAVAGRTVAMDDVVIKVNAPVANTAPGASVAASNVLPTDTGETSYGFSVTYTDNSAISVATINSSDVTVTGPGGYISTASLVSINVASDGSPRIATYTVTPPGGSWNLADNGAYTIAMVGNQVGDNGAPQLFVPAGTLGTFTVRARSLVASTFSNKGAWETAIGGPGATDFTEDFEGFATQQDFSAGPVSAPGKFTLQRVGGANVFGNFIDVDAGVQTGEVPGVPVKYAAMFVDVDSGLTVEMTFTTPVAAWYGEFSAAIDQEDIEIDLVDGSGNIIDIVEINANGGFGFTTPSPGTVAKLVFRGVNSNGSAGELFALDNISAANDYTANTNPIFTLVEADDVVPFQTGETSYSFTVSYSDNSAINVSSIGTGDVSVTGPSGALTVTGAVANNPANGTPRTVTYTVVPPGGAWSFGDNGTYTIGILANQVFDDTGNAVAAAAAAASFDVRVSSGITTVFTDRTAWTTAVGGAGGISWQEDFEGFATQQDFSSSTVAATEFTLIREGGTSPFGNFIDVDPGVQSGDVPGVPVKYAAMFVEGDAALTVVMTFNNPVSAWIGQFFNATETEDIEVDLYDESDARIDIIEVNANNGSVGFVGPTARIKKLVFRGLSNTAAAGEVFGLDNIAAANPRLDFGDAPDPNYPTLIANNGARHSIPFAGATLFLGANAPDFENNGQPNSTATGDGSDEDGLAWPAVVTAGQSASVTVTSSGAGFVNVWIDFNRDGDWADAGEHVFTDTAVVAGANPLNFTAPISAVGGASFARARLTSANPAGSLSFVGLGSDGEVEDSAVALNAPPTAGADTIERRGTQETKVMLSALLANDSDPDTDPISIVSVGSALPAGASVAINGDWIYYTPPGGSSSPGSFTYTLSDGRGGTATGLVTVNILVDNEPSQNEIAIQSLGGGVFRVTFNGIPNRNYSVEYTENLNPPNTVWTPLGQAPTGPTGSGSFDDSAGSPQRIYRTVYP